MTDDTDKDSSVESPEDLQRDVDEAIGEMDKREDAFVGEPITVSEFGELLKEMNEEYDSDDE